MTRIEAVRPAAVADAPEIAALSGALGYAAGAEEVARRLERILARSDHVVLVATADERVVGWLHAAVLEILEYGTRCDILGLVVDADCRRAGVGRRLVAAVEAWAMDRGLDQIAVRSNIARTGSHPFYERLGYTRTKTQHAYRKRLADTGQRERR